MASDSCRVCHCLFFFKKKKKGKKRKKKKNEVWKMDILKPDQNNARNGRVCTNSFLEVKLRQTLGQNGTQI